MADGDINLNNLSYRVYEDGTDIDNETAAEGSINLDHIEYRVWEEGDA